MAKKTWVICRNYGNSAKPDWRDVEYFPTRELARRAKKTTYPGRHYRIMNG